MSEAHSLAEILVQGSVDGLNAVDRDGRYMLWNRAMELFAGVKAEDVLGRNAFEVFPFLRDLGLDRVIERVLAGETIVTENCPHELPDGTRRYYDRHHSPLRDTGGGVIGALGIVRDVTDRRRAEEALRESEDRLRASQKMEAIGRLAGGVAHDFNSLLTVVLSCSERLVRSASLGPESRDLLGEVMGAARRGAALTQQLLAFSRKQPTQPQTIGLDALVTDLKAILRRLIGEQIELVTRLDAGAQGRVRADRAQLEQVILNLVLNARDAIGQRGGRIGVATGLAQRDDGADSLPPGVYVTLRVEDDGCGMKDDVKAHLFEPFFTTKPCGEGTGLGLATVFGIVRQSGGHIMVQSEPDRGSTFEVLLPALEDAGVVATRTGGPSAASPPRGRETILLVEDEAPLRRVLHAELVDAGYRVIEASSGDEALRACNEGTDLLLTDVVMPGMSGRELATQVRRTWPRARVLLMSGCDAPSLTSGDPIIVKPFTGAALAQRVREALDADA